MIERARLRRLIATFKPNMTVEVKVSTLSALLDELDALDSVKADIERLQFEGRRLLAMAERQGTGGDEDEAG
jgi:hypothetical protein